MSTTKSYYQTFYTRYYNRSYYLVPSTAVPNWNLISADSKSVVDSVTFGANIPNWRRVIREKGNATTTMIAEGTRFRPAFNVKTRVYTRPDPAFYSDPSYLARRWIDEGFGDLLTPALNLVPTALTLLIPPISRVHNMAVAGFVKRCIAEQRTFQGGVALGELRETIHAIRHPFLSFRTGLGNYLSHIRKEVRRFNIHDQIVVRRFSSPRKQERLKQFNRFVSDTWLEYSFGWKPLFNDIDDGIRTLGFYLTHRLPSKHISYRSQEIFGLSPTRLTVNSNNVSLIATYQRSDRYAERLYGDVSVENRLSPVGGSISQDYSSRYRNVGLDLRSFLPSLYELIPYSFLVDYFANVGDIIDAACFNSASVRWASLGTLHEQTFKLVDVGHLIPGGYPFWITIGADLQPSNSSYESAYFKKTRSPYVGSFVPSLEFKLPLSVGKLTNMSALLASSKYTSRFAARSLRI